ncbi:MAG: toll/interleukin-1 receptor domain-containing protein [Lachnospiraceae bacterium]|nr:toll/interleukin-1 receptor domain-containing protein [Lachnospiraceae bacterium]
MRYDAFISYRHTPLDMEMAKKVHTGLETYHVPGAVKKKTGKKKIQRVFRDQEELPIGSDLNDNIAGALKESEWLIVICSPNTPESYWVQKEIETFISMHGRDHILAVLIEGEPDDSFPELLLKDENGKPVEPLAADVRGENSKERNKKFKTEILRLAAPVLGCSYDDLRQRHRERIIRRTISLVSSGAAVVALAGAAFGVYNANVAAKMKALADEKALLAEEKTQLADEKTKLAEDILKEYREKQENQARFYAEKSLSLLAEGKRQDAALVAMEALPSEENDRPYVGEAEYALARSLYAYAYDDFYSYDRSLSVDQRISLAKRNADKSVFLVLDVGQNVYAWDTETFELKAKIPYVVGEDNSVQTVIAFNADSEGIYVCTKDAFYKYAYDGSLIYSLEPGDELKDRGNIRSCAIDTERGRAALVTDVYMYYEDVYERITAAYGDKTYVVDVVDIKSGELTGTIDNPSELTPGSTSMFSFDGRYLYVDTYTLNADEYKPGALLFDMDEMSGKKIDVPDENIKEMVALESGDFALVLTPPYGVDSGRTTVCVLDPEEAKMKWTRSADVDEYAAFWYGAALKARPYEEDGVMHSDIIFSHGMETYTYDEFTGEVLCVIPFPSEVTQIMPYLNSSRGFVTLADGTITEVDFHTGEYTSRGLSTQKTIEDAIGLNYYIAFYEPRGSEIYLLKRHIAEDYEIIHTSEADNYLNEITEDGEYLIYKCYDNDTYTVGDKDGNDLYTIDSFDSVIPRAFALYGHKLLDVDTKSFRVFDLDTKEEKFFVYEDYMDYFSASNGYITKNRKYAIVWNFHQIMLLDTEKCEPAFIVNKPEEIDGNSIINACVSEDGKYIYFSASNRNVFRVDVENKTMTEYENELLRQNDSAISPDTIAISSDGTKLAVGCFDGFLRVFDTKTGEIIDEQILEMGSSGFVTFIKNDEYIIAQGADYILKVRNYKEHKNEGSLGLNGKIKSVSEEDGLIGICASLSSAVLDDESFALLAGVAANNTVLFSVANRAFYLPDTYSTGRIYYKDYKTLVEMAKKEFAGVSLTEEQRHFYNMD